MSHLWSDETRKSRGGNGPLAAVRFKLRDDHLLKWIAELRVRVLEHDRSGFYSAALRVVEVVLEDDRN